MIDIRYYQKAFEVKQILKEDKIDGEDAYLFFNCYRQRDPVVFNIETTNICNMACSMCPRTNQMTRPMGTMSLQLFKKIVKQLRPWSPKEWQQWISFVKEKYGVKEYEMNENHFFLYIVPKVITLHGYGEPLLDRFITQRIKILKEQHIPTYFSCNPNNITIKNGRSLLWAGLDYLKFSGENIKLFEKSKSIIEHLIIERDINKDPTTIILDIVGSEKDYMKLEEMFEDYDVYMYLKSKDNQWYNSAGTKQQAIHWSEPCQFPWSSMSIMWDGTVVPCGQDFNNEMEMGNVHDQTLYDIWNSDGYRNLRVNQLLKSTKIKCFGRCDMKVIGKC